MPIGKKKEPTVTQLYSQYEAVRSELIDFKNTHRKVFTRLGELEEKMGLLENAIKNAVRPLYASKPSGEYTAHDGPICRVVVQSKFNREVDVDKLLEMYPDAETDGVVTRTVDLKALDKKVEAKEYDLTQLIKAKAVIKKPGTPAVSFKLVTEQKENNDAAG